MADDVVLNAGTGGDTIAADDIAGVKYQRVKATFGGDGVATDVDTTAGLPVAQQGTWILGANSGVDVGDVTINNGTGGAAVPIQDGGNSITVDSAQLPPALAGDGGVMVSVQNGALDVTALSEGALTDGQTFTPGADGGFPMLGVYDDIAPPGLTEGVLGVPRMSTNRNVYQQIRDAAGNERGVNVNASNQLAVAGPVTNAGTFAVQATEADGANVTLGAKADAKSTATDTTAITIMSVLKQISASIQAAAASLAGNLTVNSHAVTNAGTFAVQESGAALTSLQLIDDSVVADDAAFTPATTKLLMAGYEFDDVAPDSVDEGDAGAARMSSRREVYHQIRDAAGNERGANVNASNQLAVTGPVTNAGTFATQVDGAALTSLQLIDDPVIADDAPFTPATTKVMVAGAEFDDVAPDSVDEGDAGAVRMSANRNLYVRIRDNAGNERGLNVDANGAIAATVTNATAANLKVDASGVAVPITDNAGSLTVDGTITASNTAGDIAHDGADSGNPVKIGARARSSEIAVVANNDRTDLIADLVGKLIVLPYSNPENFVSGAITTAMLSTTTTSLLSAPASGLRNYITQITVSNTHATVLTDVIIQDGSGGTTLYTVPAPALSGSVITFPTPLRQPTTATAIFVANVTAGGSTKVSASGYKGV